MSTAVKKIKCDRCGLIVDTVPKGPTNPLKCYNKYFWRAVRFIGKLYRGDDGSEDVDEKSDLCPSCAEDYCKFLRGELVEKVIKART